jgi:hypothetical protein
VQVGWGFKPGYFNIVTAFIIGMGGVHRLVNILNNVDQHAQAKQFVAFGKVFFFSSPIKKFSLV